jgi:hypothetical protein
MSVSLQSQLDKEREGIRVKKTGYEDAKLDEVFEVYCKSVGC